MRALSALITLAVVVVAAYAGVQFMDSVGPDIAGASGGKGPSGGDGSARVKDVKPGSSESLLEPERFAKVIARIRKDYGAEAKVVNLRIEPSRADVQIPQGTSTVLLEFNNDGEETTNIKTDTDLSDNANVASITKIKADVPKRILKKVLKKSGQPAKSFEWMSITTFGGTEGVGWYISLSKGEQTTWKARLDGRKVSAQ
jgi:hypothetical protein